VIEPISSPFGQILRDVISNLNLIEVIESKICPNGLEMGSITV
jgi:hypothetical protein